MTRPAWWGGRGPGRTPPAAGTRVRSHFRARWTGEIVGAAWCPYPASTSTRGVWLVTVRVTHDRNGRPLRKPIRKELGSSWLEVLGEASRSPEDAATLAE